MKTAAVLTCRLFSIFITVMLLSTALMAQTGVKIKERVNIFPIQAPLFNTASGGDFVIEFEYSGTLKPGTSVLMNISVNGEIYIGATAPLMTGFYQAGILFYSVAGYTATYRYLANGYELKSGTSSLPEGPSTVGINDNFYLYESFKFSYDSIVVPPDSWVDAYIYSEGVIGQPAQWSPSFLTTWTVVQGSKWGQFYFYDGTPLGTTYTERTANISGLGFRLAPNIPDNEFCIIKAESGGLERYEKIYPPNYKKPELVVTPPTDPNQFITGTDLPKMPSPLVTAQLKNYNGGEVDFNWTLTIKWKANDIIYYNKDGTVKSVKHFSTPKDANEKYTGTASGQNSEIVDLEVDSTLYGETDMRGGDDITLTVTAKTVADGKVYTNTVYNTNNPFVIKGKNPEVATVLAELKNHLYSGYIVDNYAAVVWDESRFNQFSTSDDFISNPHSDTLEYPLMGGTGVGLMQLDPPPNDDVVWNWVANVQEGQRHFNTDIDAAKNYQNMEYFKDNNQTPDSLKNVPTSTDTTQNQVFLQAYCYYNGGPEARYWDWVKPVIDDNDGMVITAGHWIKNTKTWQKTKTNPETGPVDHANAVWSYFISKPWNE